MSISILASFWFVSFLFIVTPGADWAYAMSAGIRGRPAVVPSVLGLLLGHLAATFIISVGIGNVIAGIPGFLKLLTLAGASYLLWLGINMILHPAVVKGVESQHSFKWSSCILKGVCVSGLNPKLFLIFLALLPQFIDTNALWPVQMQIIALGSVHIVSCGIIYLLVGFGSQILLQSRPTAAQIVSRISGVAMVIIALLLSIDQLAN